MATKTSDSESMQTIDPRTFGHGQTKPKTGQQATPGSAEHPVVTVGMAVYNGARFIERALSALTAQSHASFRLIISDNASTDNTWEVLQEWARRDPRIELYRQEKNIGLRANFQYVLDNAQTEFFMWHSDDDWVAPNYLEELVGELQADPSCMLVGAYGIRVAQDGSEVHQEPFPDIASKSRRSRIRKLLMQPEPTWIYGVFRTDALRAAWRTAGEFGYVWASDALALLPFILNDQVRGTNRTVFYYRVNMESLDFYRPSTTYQMLRFMTHYLKFHVRLFRASELSFSDKLLLWPWLLIHVFESIFEHPFKRFIKHPAKRALKAVRLWPVRTLSGRR
jgi:glycosyltransferase involved in cell wall biosynthesis